MDVGEPDWPITIGLGNGFSHFSGRQIINECDLSNMLYQVLAELEQAHGPVLVKDLGQKLNIDTGVLMGMIEFWVRKGRLCDDDAIAEEGIACAGGGCGDHCSGLSECIFVAKMPKTYSIAKHQVKGPGALP